MSTNSNGKFLKSSFKDQEGREWLLRFDGRSMSRIQHELQINLCDAFADPKAFAASVNPSQVIAMVWIAIEKQAADRNVGDVQWLESMYAQSLLDMNDAFWAALLNFSQPEKILSSAGKVQGQFTRVINRKMEQAAQALDEVTDTQLEWILAGHDLKEVKGFSDEKIRWLLDGNSIETFTGPADTAESIPTQEATERSNG